MVYTIGICEDLFSATNRALIERRLEKCVSVLLKDYNCKLVCYNYCSEEDLSVSVTTGVRSVLDVGCVAGIKNFSDEDLDIRAMFYDSDHSRYSHYLDGVGWAFDLRHMKFHRSDAVIQTLKSIVDCRVTSVVDASFNFSEFVW